MVSFEWTVPDGVEGEKELVVEIDPDNKIDEIHEGWDAAVPGGNNFGYFPFSVVEYQSLPFKAIGKDALSIALSGMSLREFIAYAAGQPEPFDAECVITNSGGLCFVSFLELNWTAASDKEAKSITRHVGLLGKDEERSFKFLVKPEEWRNCRRLEALFQTSSGVIKVIYDSGDDGTGGSSSGCNAGLSVLGLGILLPALIIRRKA